MDATKWEVEMTPAQEVQRFYFTLNQTSFYVLCKHAFLLELIKLYLTQH